MYNSYFSESMKVQEKCIAKDKFFLHPNTLFLHPNINFNFTIVPMAHSSGLH